MKKVTPKILIEKTGFKHILLLVLFFLINVSHLQAQATYTSGATDTQIVNELQGTGLSITNPILVNGNRPTQIGVFSNGASLNT